MRVRTSLRFISANVSSHTNRVSIRMTGKSATAQCTAWRAASLIGSHDLQRGEPFGFPVVALAPSACRSDRKHHRQTKRDRKIEVELRAEIEIIVTRAVRCGGRQCATEDSWTDVAQVKCRGTDL